MTKEDSEDCLEFYLLTKKLTTDLYRAKSPTKLQRCFKEALKAVKKTVDTDLQAPYEERTPGFWYYGPSPD
tara:strand:+ start:445 stop:657 length:213 start_codon:yes stop_codon:yes gene_type:complete